MTIQNFIAIMIFILVYSGAARAQDGRRSIYAMDVDGKGVRQIISFDDYPYCGSPDVSPDGKRLALDAWKEDRKFRDSHLLIVDLATSELQDLGPGTIPSWSADGKYLAYSSYDPRGVYIRSADGVATKRIDEKGWGIHWSPDGQKLAYTVGNEFVIYDLLKDEKRSVQPNPAQPYTSVYYNFDWSPDSKKICFKARRLDSEYDIAIVDISTKEPELTVCFKFKGGYGNEFAWHPGGDRLVGLKWGSAKLGTPAQLYEFKPEPNVTPFRVTGQPEDRANLGVGWSPDGKTLFFASQKE